MVQSLLQKERSVGAPAALPVFSGHGSFAKGRKNTGKAAGAPTFGQFCKSLYSPE